MRASSPFFLATLAGGLLLSCGVDRNPPPFVGPGPGLVYSFPGDGQLDVPVGSLISLVFSEAILESEISPGCSVSGNSVTGGLCVVDSTGPVAGTWSIVGGGRAAEFTPDEPLAEDSSYAVHIASSILSPGVGNLPESGPSVRFATRSERIDVATAAGVIAINGEQADVFAQGSELSPRYPLVDFATFHLVFSEPIDERSAILGSGIEFVEVPAVGGAEIPVEGQVLAQGVHLSFDPNSDLNPESSYVMRITDSLLDLGGEPADVAEYHFSPVSSALAGELYSQVLNVAPGIEDENFPEASTVAALDSNSVLVSSSIVGDNLVQLRAGSIEGELAHPNQFTTAMPLVIRKGQRLVSSGLDVSFAGVVNSGLSTGDLTLSFASDLNGVLVRNQFWPSDTIPDDQEAPMHVYLNFDLAVSAADPLGNATLTQTVMGVQATGMAQVKDGQLHLSTVSTIELDLLGVAKGNSRVVLAFSTSTGQSVDLDLTPPELVASYPEASTQILETGDSITLSFSEAVRLRDDEAVVLQTGSGVVVDADVRTSGSMVVVTPSQPLLDDQDFRVFIGGGLLDLAGNSWSTQSSDPTGGMGVLPFTTGLISTASPQPPALLGSYPGAPCALVGDGAGSRRCQGGQGNDDDYVVFSLPANHEVNLLFDQPMDRASAVLGADCGQGSVRVEAVSGTTCDAVVPGTLFVGERSIRFVPGQPWTEGATYRLRVVGGGNGSCDNGELCGINGLPLNTDALNSPEDAGGPDVQIFFTGAAASSAHALTAGVQPIADRNGNGRVDSGETPTDTNRAVVAVADVGGIINSATMDMPDCDLATPEIEGCLYMSSDLVVLLEDKQSNCSIDTATGTVTATDCIPVTVSPGIIYGSELVMDANVVLLGNINDMSTGKTVLRVREQGQAVQGFIVEDASGNPEMLLALSTYMDAPDLEVLGGLASHDIESKPLDVTLRGPVVFRPDGRLQISLFNEALVEISVEVSAPLGLNGQLFLEIPPSGMLLDLVSSPARGGLR
jgi:methionine-rich copper-binding protein CopC